MASIFSKIINGDIPCYKVAENEHFLAFLDINPNTKGHTLCIPKVEVDDFFDLDDTTLKDLMMFCKTVAKALKKTVPCNRIGLSVVGLEVPHAHVHLIPIQSIDDVRFIKKQTLSHKEFEALAQQINSNLS